MRIALIAPPFINVPPQRYGGTELFVADLALGLKKQGHEPLVFANGESTIGVETRWLYEKSDWPIAGEIYDNLKDFNHASWAVREAMADCDVIHINNVPALFASRFTTRPFVYTIHHPHEPGLSDLYSFFPEVHYVAISRFQAQQEKLPRLRAIHHGVDVAAYPAGERTRTHLTFLGRIAPMKGAHIAVGVAREAGIPLKLAGEVQPRFREYFEREVKPHIDGRSVEYVGEAGPEEKRALLGSSLALLFPIQWDEPFGLVMIEAMACGAPVLALPGGSVAEVVRDGVSGYICESPDQMVERARNLDVDPAQVRAYVEREFSLDRMVTKYVELYEETLDIRGGDLSEPEPAVA